MEHRNRNQEPAFLYRRLGWTVRDRDPEPVDVELTRTVVVELTDKSKAPEPETPKKPNA